MSKGIYEQQKYIAVSKYARWVDKLERREVWEETVARYQSMLVEKYPHRQKQITDDCQSVEKFEVMPSMRGLQFGGPPVFKHNARLYNCTGSYLDRLRFFGEAFYLLLCGSGVGFSVQERHLQHLPKFSKKRQKGVRLPKKKFKPEDKIEGWADCANVMMSAYHEEPVIGFEEYHECEPSFDYTGIRDEGVELSFGIGRAPGPMPLRNANERVRRLINRLMEEGLTKFNSLGAYDVTMHYSDAVVSGGVRRSATIVLFDLWDSLMLGSKTGNWRAVNPQRGRSNNSVILIRDRTSFEEFERLFAATKEFGEPGFYWTDHPDSLPNPCVEIGFWPMLQLLLGQKAPRAHQGPIYNLDDGSQAISGWQMCNLTTVNGKTLPSHRPEKDSEFVRRCGVASRLGTWQAGFTNFPYLGEVSEGIARREALLGVSIAGIMHHPDVLLDPKTLREGAKSVLKENDGEAKLIGINPTARATCVKPDGNSSSLLGCFSGCHPGKFRKGMRLVQANKNEAPYQYFKSVNPQACEPSVWSANGTDDVVRFCVEYEGLLEEELTANEFLGHVRTVYENWVKPGKVEERCTQPWLSHNVSNTVRVREDEWGAVAKDIYDNRESHSGVSFISVNGDRDFPQAPFTSVWNKHEQEVMYGKTAVAAADAIIEEAERHFSTLWDACDLVLDAWDLYERTPTPGQFKFKDIVSSFAGHLFDQDNRKATYCLKDAWNWKKYGELKRSYKEVDYSLMKETCGSANFQQEVACAGGACES